VCRVNVLYCTETVYVHICRIKCAIYSNCVDPISGMTSGESGMRDLGPRMDDQGRSTEHGDDMACSIASSASTGSAHLLHLPPSLCAQFPLARS
jgi:hypothetical protein